MKGAEGEGQGNGAARGRHGRGKVLRRTMLAVFLLGLAALAYLGGGFVRFARDVAFLTTPPTAARADGIVVLTGGEQRIRQALDLLDDGKGQRLLISGVNRGTSAQALARTTGADRSLFECCVDLDYEALNTIGNAEMTTRWAREHGFRRLLLVTSDYHIPRSLLELADVPDAPEIVPYPVSPDKLWRRDGWPTRLGLRLLATEYAKVLAVKARVAWNHVVRSNEERRVAGHRPVEASFK